MLSQLVKLFFRPAPGLDTTNRKIFRAAVTVGSVGLAARSGLVLKDLVVARAFGRNDQLDAYLIAYLLPSFMASLLMSSLGTALIPTFVETRQQRGAAAAQKLFSSALFVSIFALAGLALLLGLFAPYYLPLLGSGFSSEKLRLTRELLYCLLPFVLFSGFTLFVSAVLNAGEKFALPALVPIVTPLVTIALVLVEADRWGAFSLAAGIVLGSFLEGALLVRALRVQGIRLAPKWGGLDPDVRSVLTQYGPMVAAAFLMSGTSIVDQSMAAMLSAGSVAALSYASKTVSFVMLVAGSALFTAIFPYFSRMAAENDWAGCRHTLKRYSVLTLWVTIPLTLLLMLLSRPLVRLLFQRGAFTGADTALVSWVQVCYAIQIPFYLGGSLFVRFLSSIKRNDVLMYGAGISLILDVVLNLILMRFWGIAGIALSTSLVLLVSFFFLGACSVRLLRQRYFSGVATRVQEAGQ